MGLSRNSPFGYGLSYTKFKLSNLSVAPAKASTVAAGRQARAVYGYIYDIGNTGARAGADVAQVYIGEKTPAVPRPTKELKGFARVELAPGETKHVSIALDARSFAYYDVAGKQWQVDSGAYSITVGESSADAALSGSVSLANSMSITNKD